MWDPFLKKSYHYIRLLEEQFSSKPLISSLAGAVVQGDVWSSVYVAALYITPTGTLIKEWRSPSWVLALGCRGPSSLCPPISSLISECRSSSSPPPSSASPVTVPDESDQHNCVWFLRDFLTAEDKEGVFNADHFPLWYKRAAEQVPGTFVYSIPFSTGMQSKTRNKRLQLVHIEWMNSLRPGKIMSSYCY